MKVKSGSANRPKYKIKYTMCPYLVLTTLQRFKLEHRND